MHDSASDAEYAWLGHRPDAASMRSDKNGRMARRVYLSACMMRRGLNGTSAHRAICAECGARANRYSERRRIIGLSSAEQRIIDRAWASLTDQETFAYKARAALMGDVPEPRKTERQAGT